MAPSSGRATAPMPGQIWFADVPFDDGSGSKDRPCLIVVVTDKIGVLKITSRPHQYGYLRMPTRTWDRTAERDSWVQLRPTRWLHPSALRRPAGWCDQATWHQVMAAQRPGPYQVPVHSDIFAAVSRASAAWFADLREDCRKVWQAWQRAWRR